MLQERPLTKLVDKIHITEEENEIFNTFRQFRNETNLKTQLRVAGGWVRDKLMGLESHDIDIALDDMMGEEFVKLMNIYLQSKHEKTKGFGVTRFNPEKSKHLETACVMIKDRWIDVVNLRGETYTEHSRVPTIQIGTPEQDAFRRDLTINSMFYNLDSELVEDFTKQGMDDLKNGIIRTPLEPQQTFLDDPLRILRTFRFATRFGFTIVQPIYDSLTEVVKNALTTKVSKERVGKEIEWMLKFKDTQTGLQLYHNNNLWDAIFQISPQSTLANQDSPKIQLQSYILTQIVSQNQHLLAQLKNLQKHLPKEEINFYAFLSAICFPYNAYTCKLGKASLTLTSFILQESLKFPKKETNNTQLICEQINVLENIYLQPFQLSFNQIVKFIQTAGALWELVVFLKFCTDRLRNANISFDQYQQFIDFIYQNHLEQFYDVKPLIDGSEVCQLLKIKPGPEIKLVLSNCLLKQAASYGLTKEQLIQDLKEHQEQFLAKQQ